MLKTMVWFGKTGNQYTIKEIDGVLYCDCIACRNGGSCHMIRGLKYQKMIDRKILKLPDKELGSLEDILLASRRAQFMDAFKKGFLKLIDGDWRDLRTYRNGRLL